MRTAPLKIIALLALASLAAVAQRRMPRDPAEMAQRHAEFLARRLSLNTQQQQQANTIFTEEANNTKALREQMRTAHEALKSAVEKNDSAGIEQAANTIGNLTTQMTLAHARAQATLFQTLTPEQQSRLSQFEHSGPGMHGRGWRGGPPPGASFQ